MRRFIQKSGVFFAEITKPEDKALFNELSNQIQNELSEDITSTAFLVKLMRHYAETRKHHPAMNARPMM